MRDTPPANTFALRPVRCSQKEVLSETCFVTKVEAAIFAYALEKDVTTADGPLTVKSRAREANGKVAECKALGGVIWRKDVAELLLKHHAEVNAKNNYAQTPLLVATFNGRTRRGLAAPARRPRMNLTRRPAK